MEDTENRQHYTKAQIGRYPQNWPLSEPSCEGEDQRDAFSYDQKQNPYGSQPSTARDGPANPPYPMHPSERMVSPTSPGSGYPPNQTTGSIAGAANSSPLGTSGFPQPPKMANKAPSRPVFGVSLEELFARDQSAVPMVVYQCMQAVDLFGLEVEGIYRTSGTATHVTTLRDAFNNNALST